MSVQTHRALQLLPSCATTGIGSLPHTQLELALQTSLQLDVPYLPQLPAGNPAEFMIPGALEGLPGMRFDAEGMVTVDLAEWNAQQEDFGHAIEVALQSDELSSFEPTAQACRAWKPFLWEVENRKLAFAKVQIAGPTTVRWVSRTSDGQPATSLPALERQMYRLVLVRSLAMVKAVRRANATPIIFLDEPGLYALKRSDPLQLVALQELKLLVLALRREGAVVGLHFCGNTPWAPILELGLDLLSIDVRLSLDAVLDERAALERFLATGASLSLGIVPTNLDAHFNVAELVDAVDVSLQGALGARRGAELLRRVLLTPACGLAMRKVADAERLLEQLRVAQQALLKLIESSSVEVQASA